MGFMSYRSWPSWLFRTLILHLFIIYVSIPFLIRLFPALLAKFVFLNIGKYSSHLLVWIRNYVELIAFLSLLIYQRAKGGSW